MRSMLKLALLVGVSAPAFLAPALHSSVARADGPAAAPAAPVAPSAAPTPGTTTTTTVTNTTTAPATAPAAPTTGVLVTDALPAGTVAVVTPVVDGLVQVHIRTKELVTIQHRRGPDAEWQTACETPCDARLPATDEYRVIGKGLEDSEPFLLTSPKGDVVNINVQPGIKSRARTGEIMTFTGVVVTVGAIVVGIAAANPGDTFSANGTTNNYNWNVIAGGTTIAVAGLVTGILGGAWWYDNAHTRVAGDVENGKEPPARGGLEPRYQTGMRTPAPNVATYGTTIFSTSF